MSEKKVTKETPKELPPRIHIREFLFDKGLSDMQSAGFKAFVGQKEWMRPDEWKTKFDEYNPK